MHKLFAYPGGKWPIRHLVVNAFPEHTTFVDVFGGSAAILLTKELSPGEVFNDANEEIVNFFRVVKHRPAELAERSRHWMHSRTLWGELRKAVTPADEVEKAFRFWVLVADSFGSRGDNFGTTRSGVRSVTKAREHLSLVADRFKNVHVEHLDFRKCIRMYDAPDTFFYLDPPYRDTKGGDSHYGLLSDDDWREMRELLSSMNGKFLLSHSDDPFVRSLFSKFNQKTIRVRVSLPREKSNRFRREVLIGNYPIPKLSNESLNSKRKGDADARRSSTSSRPASSRSTTRGRIRSAVTVHRGSNRRSEMGVPGSVHK